MGCASPVLMMFQISVDPSFGSSLTGRYKRLARCRDGPERQKPDGQGQRVRRFLRCRLDIYFRFRCGQDLTQRWIDPAVGAVSLL